MNAVADTPLQCALILARENEAWTPASETHVLALYRRAAKGISLVIGHGLLVPGSVEPSPTASVSYTVLDVGELTLDAPPTAPLEEVDVYLTEDEVRGLRRGTMPRLQTRRASRFVHSAAGLSARLAAERAAVVALCLWPVADAVLELHEGHRIGLKSGLECLRVSGIWDLVAAVGAIQI